MTPDLELAKLYVNLFEITKDGSILVGTVERMTPLIFSVTNVPQKIEMAINRALMPKEWFDIVEIQLTEKSKTESKNFLLSFGNFGIRFSGTIEIINQVESRKELKEFILSISADTKFVKPTKMVVIGEWL